MIEFPSVKDINVDGLARLCSQSLSADDFAMADEIEQNIVVYNGARLLNNLVSAPARQQLKTELYYCLKEGPGVLVIKGFYGDLDTVDRSTEIFRNIIDEEKTSSHITGDHFASAGENERIWNSFQKVCERDPLAFIKYYQNPLYALIAEAWLGPGYQMTAQVNVVKPGGKAQAPHRDYHLGFQSLDIVEQFPLALQIASQYLTLQGAIAHSDMPIESGPTILLPFSHQYEMGYLAWREKEFKDFFAKNGIQIALQKGDAIFFSPALFHAAGNNSTGSDRMANLIQISAAFGRTMESVDRYRMMKLIYPYLLERADSNGLSIETQTIINLTAEGYSFPTNLDILPPIDGSAPETAQQLIIRAISEDWSVAEFNDKSQQHEINRKA